MPYKDVQKLREAEVTTIVILGANLRIFDWLVFQTHFGIIPDFNPYHSFSVLRLHPWELYLYSSEGVSMNY